MKYLILLLIVPSITLASTYTVECGYNTYKNVDVDDWDGTTSFNGKLFRAGDDCTWIQESK